jgi:phosphoribosyl 1,2-cyclic phosphodiesterase
LRFISLASGSKGNSYLAQSNGTSVLVDAGLSGREIERRLQQVGVMPSQVDAILLTHEHADHMRGAAIFSRRHGTTIVGTEGTLGSPCGRYKPVAEGSDRLETLPAGGKMTIGALAISSFSTSHDASDPVGYTFAAEGFRLTLAADLGVVDEQSGAAMQSVDALILESNHCPLMLNYGPYPAWLKARVAGDFGHLSNNQAIATVRDVLHPGLRYLLLGHLSENNNTPRQAFDGMRAVLDELAPDVDLRVCRQNVVGNWIDLNEETV